jgi:hypothetical protein
VADAEAGRWIRAFSRLVRLEVPVMNTRTRQRVGDISHLIPRILSIRNILVESVIDLVERNLA